MSTEERFDLERQHRDQESTQSRYAGRGKFNFCHRCGSEDGMRAVHRDIIDSMSAEALRLLDTLYYASGNSTYLFSVCHRCNRNKVIPDGLSALGLDDMLCWINIGSPRPGYDALAAEPERALASLVDHDSAGLEG